MKLEAGKTLSDEKLIGLAPSWATHYRYNIGEVMFESKNKWMAIGFDFPFITRGPYKQVSKLTKCVKLPESKPFDISEYEFEDGDIESANRAMGGRLFLNLSNGDHVQLCESDVKALSKHFKLI